MAGEINETYSRIILLNRLVSRSVTRAPQEHKAPLHSGIDLFNIIDQRVKDKVCIEFFNVDENIVDDAERIKANKNKDSLRINKIQREVVGSWLYLGMLVTFIDQRITTFPVIDIEEGSGRDLRGGQNERGSFIAHVVVRLPIGSDQRDEGSYRCAVESVTNLSRSNIEKLWSRQLRRVAETQEWSFDVEISGKRKPETKHYRYHPRIELLADVGRSMFGSGSGAKTLSHLVFTNQHEKRSFPDPTAIHHEDFFASVELRVSAKQGPDDPEEKRSWIEQLKRQYELRGYKTKMYFRSSKGDRITGTVNPSVEGATDLLMCPREVIHTAISPNKWLDAIQPEIYDKMKALLDRDELWAQAN